MSISRLVWGMVLLGAGLLLLGANLGWWGNDVWWYLIPFWPVIIVIIGLRLIVRDDGMFGILFLIIVAAIILIATQNPYGFRDKIVNSSGNPVKSTNSGGSVNVTENNDNVTKMTMRINIGAAKMILKGVQGADLFHLTTENMGSVQTHRNDTNGVSNVEISEEGINTFNGFSNRKFNLDISDSVPTDLTVNNGASDYDFDFSNLKLNSLNINTGASSGTVKFGTKVDSVVCVVKAGASSLNVKVPQGYALKVKSSSVLASLHHDGIDMAKNGNVYQTSDFGTNSKKIEIEFSTGASSINLTRY